MNILILGGTGSIGSAVTAELVAAHHQVVGLCRSQASAKKLTALGARPVQGDLRAPKGWYDALQNADAVIQVACTFEDNMGAVDSLTIEAIGQEARRRRQPLRVLYTGGCWLYGETGDLIASETSARRPIPAFAWMEQNAGSLLEDPNLNCCVVHPAMVYHESGGGVFARMLQQASVGLPLEVWGSLHTRWPLVHRRDLARAYRMLIERPGLGGHYNVAAQSGVPVQEILTEIVTRHRHAAPMWCATANM
ncbi:NAD-dependent epimerase/dehydratase family protein [Pseudophaeobacter leonis]|uniref:NAD-dependent epimerase/dehydratase family protein n=1 Tax=Pseudophaeobacter leonis TaxID=1144477 RepID=UPI001F4D5BF2|nr:NAD-dependent epimerase/dehydratase family protein [Pseudophaeobacter leonis]